MSNKTQVETQLPQTHHVGMQHDAGTKKLVDLGIHASYGCIQGYDISSGWCKCWGRFPHNLFMLSLRIPLVPLDLRGPIYSDGHPSPVRRASQRKRNLVESGWLCGLPFLTAQKPTLFWHVWLWGLCELWRFTVYSVYIFDLWPLQIFEWNRCIYIYKCYIILYTIWVYRYYILSILILHAERRKTETHPATQKTQKSIGKRISSNEVFHEFHLFRQDFRSTSTSSASRRREQQQVS